MYYSELEQKEKINSRITVPLAILGILVGGVGYFMKYINKLPNETWVGYFRITLFFFIILVTIAIGLVSFAYYGYSYKYIASPRSLKNNINKLKKYYDDNYEEFFKEETKKTKEKLVYEDFNDDLCKQYIEATQNNIKLNEKKLFLLRLTGWFLIASAVMGAVAYFLLMSNFNF